VIRLAEIPSFLAKFWVATPFTPGEQSSRSECTVPRVYGNQKKNESYIYQILRQSSCLLHAPFCKLSVLPRVKHRESINYSRGG
jgi:hypothetical protein